jgi:hypothetical protein
MTVEELRAVPAGRPRRSKHDDMTCLVRTHVLGVYVVGVWGLCVGGKCLVRVTPSMMA